MKCIEKFEKWEIASENSGKATTSATTNTTTSATTPKTLIAQNDVAEVVAVDVANGVVQDARYKRVIDMYTAHCHLLQPG